MPGKGEKEGEAAPGTPVSVPGWSDLPLDTGGSSLLEDSRQGSQKDTQASGEEWLARIARSPEEGSSPSSEMLLLPGDRIGEQYEIVRLLGRGGMARVYLGRDLRLGRQVAVKLMAPPSAEAQVRERWLSLFEQEARATARMSHPHIVTVYHFGTWKEHPFLILERLHGSTLSERLSRGPLPVEEALRITAQVLSALVHAHGRGIFHRDLKPHNIWVTDEDQVKVLDFGLAMLTGTAAATDTLEFLSAGPLSQTLLRAGTPAYMAKEQWEGAPQDGRTDVWAVGLVLLEMLTGPSPFHGESVESLKERVCAGEGPVLGEIISSQLPASLRDFVFQTLRRTREDRPDARSLLKELESLRSSSLPSHPGAVAAAETSPYRWLESFRPEDAAWFFGRDREVARLMTFLETHPAVMVVARSGGGKSSLVHAGLLPRLTGTGGWLALSFRPGRHPLHALDEKVSQLCGRESLSSPVHREGPLPPGSFGEALRRHAAATGKRILVILDQAEEMFTLGEDAETRATFTAALESLADDPASPVRLVITLREDFLSVAAACFDVHGSVLEGLWLLPPPDEKAMKDALVRPAQRLGWSFEEGLADTMVNSLQGRVSPLPLLQLAASRLFEGRDPSRSLLTVESFAALGGIEGILATHADEVVEALPDPEDLPLARELFCALVTPERTRRQRERAWLERLGEDRERMARVIDHLLRGRLLTISRSEGQPSIELIHEALIEKWDRLKRWLMENRDLQRFRERLRDAAHHWQEAGRPGGLLWADESLSTARAFRSSLDGLLTQEESAFLEAGETKAQRLRRRRIRSRFALVIMAVAIVLGSVGSALLLRGRQQEALAAQRAAEAQVLANDSREMSAVDSMASLELAARGGETSPSARVLDTLRDSLMRPYPIGGMQEHRDRIRQAALRSDGMLLLTASMDGTARAWNWEGKSLTEFRGHTQGIQTAAFSPDGSTVASSSLDGTGRIWTVDGKERAVLSGGGHPMLWVAWAPDGERLLTTDKEGVIRVWSSNGTPGPMLRTSPGSNPVAAFQPGGDYIASGGEDGMVRFFTGEGRLLAEHKAGAGAVRGIAWSPDGEMVLTASDEDPEVFVWSARGAPLGRWKGHSGGVTEVFFSPDGKSVVSLSYDRTARLWSPQGKALAVFQGHTGRVITASFNPQGTLLATACDDRTARHAGDFLKPGE